MTEASEPVPVSTRFEILQNENGENRFCKVTLLSNGKRIVEVIKEGPK